jgi:integrase
MDTNGIDSADYLRFKLLTGCRGVEIKGDAFGNKPIRVRDVDLTSGRIILQDTKNRQEHTLLLSTQALEIAKKKASGKKPNDLLFNIKYPRRMLMTINRETGLSETAHDEHSLRDTFASIADELVSQYTLKKMINHSSSSDVTGHYVGKGEGQLRAGWQAVADFIEEQAKPFSRSLI